MGKARKTQAPCTSAKISKISSSKKWLPVTKVWFEHVFCLTETELATIVDSTKSPNLSFNGCLQRTKMTAKPLKKTTENSIQDYWQLWHNVNGFMENPA